MSTSTIPSGVRPRFSVSQPITLAAQAQQPEVGWEVERAAGAYLLAAARGAALRSRADGGSPDAQGS